MNTNEDVPELPYHMIWQGEYDKTDPEVSYNRGKLAFNYQDYERAINETMHAINLKPDYLNAQILLANSYKASNQFEKAIQTFEKAEKYIEDKDSVKSFIGSVYDKEGKLEEAIKYYSEAIKINPLEYNWISFRADARLRLKHYSYAFFDLTRVIEILDRRKLRDTAPHIFKKRGTVRYYLSDFVGAVDDLTVSIKLNDKPDGEVFFFRGLSFKYLNQIELCDVDMREALKLGIKNASKHISEP